MPAAADRLGGLWLSWWRSMQWHRGNATMSNLAELIGSERDIGPIMS